MSTILAGVVLAASSLAQTAAPTSTSPAAPPPEGALDPSVAQAREAFVRATALANRERWLEALDAFQRSSALRPHPVTTYDVAYSERALGHYTRAYKFFRRCLAEHEAATHGRLTPDLQALARGYLLELGDQLARALVRLTPADAALFVDGRPLEAASEPSADHPVFLAGALDDHRAVALPRAPFEVLLDPGQHSFVVSVSGAPDQITSEWFESGASRSLTLDGAPSKASPPRAPVAPVREVPRVPRGRMWAFVAYGVGGAALTTSAIFGVLALNKKSFLDSEGRCVNGVCAPRFAGDVDAAYRDASVASVGLGVGLAGAALGTYLFLSTRPKEREKSQEHSVIEPLLGPSLLGARGRF